MIEARWLPAVTWLAYAMAAYVLWSAYHRLRYGRSPVAGGFPPRDLYGWIDLALGVCLVAYSAWIVLGAPPRPVSVALGLAVWGAGFALRVWAVVTLGRSWRIGQDERDAEVEYVATGPYRILRHPINAALIVVAIGQLLLTGPDARAAFLLAFAVAYYVAQARAEERYWARRREQEEDSPHGHRDAEKSNAETNGERSG